MKKNIKLLLTMSILVLGLFAAPTTTQAQATDVKVGILSPLTGALGVLGQGFVDAANLALDDVNGEQSDYNFILEVQDTATSSSQATTAATNLVAEDVIGVIGAAASSSTLAAISVLKDAKIPLVSYASTSPSLTTNDDDGYLFRVVPSDALQGQAAAALADDQSITTVAIINIDDAYGQGLAGAFQEAFENDGGDVLAEVAYNQEETTDFSTQVTSLVDAGAQAVYMVSFVSDGQAILNELSDQGFTGTIIGSDGIATDSLINDTAAPGISDSALGIIGTAPTVSGSAAFNTAFEAEYGGAPSIFNAESYDAAYLIAQAYLDAADSIADPTGEDVKDSLPTVGSSYAGVSGTFSFDSNGDRTTANYDIWQFQEVEGDTALAVVGSYTSADGLSDLTIVDYSSDDDSDEPSPFNLAGVFIALALGGVVTTLRRRRN